MLTLDKQKDFDLMRKYYRASDMLDFWYFFPDASHLERLAICLDEEDYLSNKDYFDSFDSYRVDSPKTDKLITGIESDGAKTDYVSLLKRIKKVNENGVILFFDLKGIPSKRYERLAGISVNVNIDADICIEAVGKGFDGREISKGICVHERYFIPWFEIRSLTIDNFHKYNVYMIDQTDYSKTRNDRINYLLSLGLKKEEFIDYIPIKYEKIKDDIWDNLIKTVISQIEKKEDLLLTYGYKNFSINGNTEGNECYLWQMYNKDRY